MTEAEGVLTIARGLVEYSYGPATWRQIVKAAEQPIDPPLYSVDSLPERRIRPWTGPPIRPELQRDPAVAL